MENVIIEFSKQEIEKLKKLTSDFCSFYENEKEWNFADLEAQREIAVEIVQILENRI